MLRVRTLVVGLAACANGLGCSLIFSADGFSSQPHDGSGESGADTGAQQEGGGGDASADGAIIEPSGPFCAALAKSPAFCVDFDSSSKVDDGFTFLGQSGQPGTVAALDHGVFVSAPNSAHLGVPAGVPGTSSGLVNRLAWETSDQQQGKISSHVEAKVWANALDPFTKAQVFAATFRQGATTYAISLAVNGYQAEVLEASSSVTTTPLTKSFPARKWVRVALDVTFTPAPAKLVLSFDGETILDKPLAAGFVSGFGQVSLGPVYYTSATVAATDLYFDNVLVNLE